MDQYATRRRPHRSYRGLLLYGAILFFAVWCCVAFRADIAQISLQRVLSGWDAILFAALLSLFNFGCRAARWHLYLGKLGFRLRPAFTALTYIAGFAFTLLPGKVGELARARYYTAPRIPLGHIAAAFFVERLIDLLAVMALALGALASASNYRPFFLDAMTILGAVLGVLALLPWERLEGAHRRVHANRGGLWHKWLGQALGALTQARALLKPGILVISLVLALAAWTAQGIGLKVISTVIPGAGLDYPGAIGIYATAMIAGAFSFMPGGLGSAEAVMVALLVTRGYSLSDSILLTLVCRICTLWLAVAAGWCCVLVLRRRDSPAAVPG